MAVLTVPILIVVDRPNPVVGARVPPRVIVLPRPTFYLFIFMVQNVKYSTGSHMPSQTFPQAVQCTKLHKNFDSIPDVVHVGGAVAGTVGAVVAAIVRFHVKSENLSRPPPDCTMSVDLRRCDGIV